MRLRIRFALLLSKLGRFIQSLPVVVMRPDDLIEFSRQTYAEADDVETWARDSFVNSGLTPDEMQLIEAIPTKSGCLLVLGVGGGRDAIPLAQMGFRVTGVDFVPAMVARAKENAARRGVLLEGLVQEISRLEVPADAYDVIWFSRSMYSAVPTRKRRIEMVRRITRALKPNGYFLCQFHWDPNIWYSSKNRLARRLVAMLTLGNLEYEDGDILWIGIEFQHEFSTEAAIRSELEEGGLSVLSLLTGPTAMHAGAVCRKNLESSS